MTFLNGQDKPSLDDVIEHHGVKGQKWGVRRENRISSLERVAAGTGNTKDKIVALNNASGASLIRNKGLKGAAGNKAANLRALDARVARGEGSRGDHLSRSLGNVVDLGGKDKDLKPSKPERVSRKEKRALTAAEQHAFYEKKIQNIVEVASRDSESLIALKTQNEALIVTGEQFIHHISSGGVLDARLSDVYATRNTNAAGKRTGPYVLNPNINAPYRPSR